MYVCASWSQVLVIEHELNDRKVWALYGHLSAASTADKQVGDRVSSGQVVGWLGDKTENGGWPSQCAPPLLHVIAMHHGGLSTLSEL